MSLIVIVTGERDWTDGAAIENYLERLVDQTKGMIGFVLGDNPAGADAIAFAWAKRTGAAYVRVLCEPPFHDPRGWPEKGPARNLKMVDHGKAWAELLDGTCLFVGFWSGKIKRSGTLDCMAKAAFRGISGYVVAR